MGSCPLHRKPCSPRPAICRILFSLLLLLLCSSSSAQQLSPSQIWTLLRLQRILEYPPALTGWNKYTSFCYLPPSPSLSLSCSGNRVTELSLVGARNITPLSSNFSIDSLFATLARLPNLTALSLVSAGLWGPLSPKVNRLSSLQILNLSSNSIHGEIPVAIASLASLKSLVLSDNLLNGTCPDLTSLPVLQELSLGGNRLGPQLPAAGRTLVTLVLTNNRFQTAIPPRFQNFYSLRSLDVSSNQLVGPIPSFLFSLPSIQHLDFSGNRLAGELPENLFCRDGLGFVDLSRNLLIGKLPMCIRTNSSKLVVLDSGNCLSNSLNSSYQHPNSYCNQGALAAVLPIPSRKKNGSKSKFELILGIAGGVVGGLLILGMLLFLVLKKALVKNAEISGSQKSFLGKASVQVSPRLPADARHMSQAVRLGSLGLTPYHIFNMEELDEATNYFDPSNLVREGSQGQMYKGWLQDGSAVMIRCLKLKQKHPMQSLLQYMNVVSKLRHRHLVSILGHCIVNGQDNPNTASTIYLIFEYVSNGTLRSHLTEWRKREMLKWPQRVSAVIGVARGIQFLHTVTVPGITGNDLSIEDIMLDETLTAKINNYNLPMLSKSKNNKVGSQSPLNAVEEKDPGSTQGVDDGDKKDVYQLGLILLEVVTGKPVATQTELEAQKQQLQNILTDSPSNVRSLTDPTIHGTFAYDSLRTVVEVTLNCVSKDHRLRPSIDDVLWNLQYSVQVQDGWACSESLSNPS